MLCQFSVALITELFFELWNNKHLSRISFTMSLSPVKIYFSLKDVLQILSRMLREITYSGLQ